MNTEELDALLRQRGVDWEDFMFTATGAMLIDETQFFMRVGVHMQKPVQAIIAEEQFVRLRSVLLLDEHYLHRLDPKNPDASLYSMPEPTSQVMFSQSQPGFPLHVHTLTRQPLASAMPLRTLTWRPPTKKAVDERERETHNAIYKQQMMDHRLAMQKLDMELHQKMLQTQAVNPQGAFNSLQNTPQGVMQGPADPGLYQRVKGLFQK